MKSLCIISHTEHYLLEDGRVVGLGSTVTEINHLLEIFETIIHVGMLHETTAPPSALPYESDKIRFVPIPAVGGSGITAKLTVLTQAPKILKTVSKALNETDCFQFRAPTGIGVFVIPYLMFRHAKKGWFKYAGNWNQEQAPWAYRFQKWLLHNQSRPVTINGVWEHQPQHCMSFENPCLTDQEIQSGQGTIASKTFEAPLELCFVGRLEEAKGVDLILEALEHLDSNMLKKIKTLHLLGAGTQMANYQQRVTAKSLPVQFHGHVSRGEVHDIYKRSHAILLPSASEGFPKVIAEAMNYGCVPIVSQVSAIGHYIKDHENGFLMPVINVRSLVQCLNKLLAVNQKTYKSMSSPPLDFIERFSYGYYNQRIKQDIL